MLSNLKGFLVLDIVFEGQSLNYDQGIGNVQQLKKIHYEGETYTMVSRYALRYSLLETGKSLWDWKLADRDAWVVVGGSNQKVLQPNYDLLCKLLDYEDLNFFGFLLTGESKKSGATEKNETKNKEDQNKNQMQIARPAAVKITHAISLEPYKFDSHFNVNLGIAKRAGKLGEVQNIFQLEEHRSLYKYSVAVDLAALGTQEIYFNSKPTNLPNDCESSVKEEGEGKYYKLTLNSSKDQRNLLLQLAVSILRLHRSIKGRNEDLSPKLMIASYYPDWYKSYFNSIQLRTGKSRSTIIKRENDGSVIVEEQEAPHLTLIISDAISDKSIIYKAQSLDAQLNTLQGVAVHNDPKEIINFINQKITNLNEDELEKIKEKVI